MECLAVLLILLPAASGQLAGTMVEMPPPVDVAYCTKSRGCQMHHLYATLDANWRYIHGMQCTGKGAARQCSNGGNCYTGSDWDKTQCPDPKSCAENCALEAVTAEQYKSTYGVSAIKGGLKLGFMTGQNAGSRLYLTEHDGEKYKLFRLKNREFSFDVDVSTLPCGLNGAVYFSEMDASGGLGGRNKAGAKYGTGYCDAQCPHDVKFMDGAANILEWNSSTTFGKWGSCCFEMDIWEANRESTAFTTHPCALKGTKTCTGKVECGGLPDERKYRYQGVCDKDGCDFNSFRNGDEKFFGRGPEFQVDSSKPFTVVTQWITDDGTDTGDLVEIRRLHVQDGKVIKNSRSSILPGHDEKDDSITDAYCDAQKAAFGDPNEHKKKGGLKAMGESLDRGVVLVASLWDDKLTHMVWLDSYDKNKSKLGYKRGPCKRSEGNPDELRGTHGDASVKYTNFMVGELDSTYTKEGRAYKPENVKQRKWPPPGAALQPSGSGGPVPGERAFAQCGGRGWTGSTTCGSSSCKCVAQGPDYSQCTPPAGAWICGADSKRHGDTSAAPAAAPATASDAPQAMPQRDRVPASQQPVSPASTGTKNDGSAFSQCGGGPEWTGSTKCAGSCTCTPHGDSYSQCEPPTGQWLCGASMSAAAVPALPDRPAHGLVGACAAGVGSAVTLVALLVASVRQRRRQANHTGTQEESRLLEAEDA